MKHLQLIALFLAAPFVVANPETPTLPEKHYDFLDTYCLTCHDSLTEKGKVNLEELPFEIATIEDAELWQKVLNSINAKEMPPEDKKQPEGAEKADFLADLAETMVLARKSLSDSGGQITMRRLNRREYQNTIEHLTGIRIDIQSLPADGGGGTFDTEGASQYISSDQFEQYLKLGRTAIDEVFARRASQQPAKTLRVEPEKTINPQNEKIIKGIEETQARYTRWREAVDKIKDTPENQAIIAEIRKQDSRIDHPIHFYRFADKFKDAPKAKDYGFIDSAKAFSNGPLQDRANLALHKHVAALPHRDRGTYLKLAHGTGRVVIGNEKLKPGNYTLRVMAGAAEGSPASRRFIDIGHPQRDILSREKGLAAGPPIATRQVSGTVEQPELLEIPLEISIDTPREFAVQEKQPNNGNLKALWDTHNAMKKQNGFGIPPAIWIDWIELEGPHPTTTTPSTDALTHSWIEEDPETNEATRARKILKHFAHEAFRDLTPEDDYLDRLVTIFETRRKAGEPFDIAIRTPLSVILASPGFLYLNEPNNADKRRTLTDRQLAVRLSYFLWSAPPDDELLTLASKKELSKPETLRKQVTRLLADDRSNEFVSGFVHQWLDMERLDFFQFDSTLHREFDESTRAASRKEVYESFAHLMRTPEDGQLGKLLKSDYVFINGLLAAYYGIEGITGEEFRKVALPADSPRGGLLGMAAIHAMGSDGIESSPVERGAWVLRHLLHDAPPPAPPNVPQLSRLADKPLTTREKLAAHMEEAQCASCHRKIDPIGFGLENFDAAGKWRTEERTGKKNHKIDPSGAFHNGPAFANYFELRDHIAKREDDFARGFTEHLIGYALGRPFGFTDDDLANEVMQKAKTKQYALSEFIHALIQSKAFHQK